MLHTGLTYGIVYRRNKTNKTTAGQDKSKQNRTLDWRRSARRQALSSASAPLSTPRCHMPTFFAAVMMLTHRVSLSRKIFHVYNFQYAVMKFQYVVHNHMMSCIMLICGMCCCCCHPIYIINEFIVCEMRISLGVSGWRRTRTQWRVTAERCRWVIKAWSKKYSHWHSYTIPLYSYQVLNSIRSMPPWEEGDATFLPLTYWMFEKRFKRKAIACYTWSMKGILYNISIKYVRCSKRRPRQSNAGWSWLYT